MASGGGSSSNTGAGGGAISLPEGPSNTGSTDSTSSPAAPQLALRLPPQKKPRGRPPGSKNKPKPPAVVLAKEPDPSVLRPCVLDISPGSDIVESIVSFARRGAHSALTVLSASGVVSSVTLRDQPETSPLPGHYNLLSLTGYFISRPEQQRCFCSFAVYLDGPNRQVLGGVVAGKVVAATPVVVVVATFENPSFHRLPFFDNDDDHLVTITENSECNNAPALSVTNASGGGTFTSMAVHGVGGMFNPNPTRGCNVMAPPPSVGGRWAPSSRPPY